MSDYEVRLPSGQFLELFSDQTSAETFIADKPGWTVTPVKSVKVRKNGSLIETFDTTDEANAYITAQVAAAPPNRRGGASLSAANFSVEAS